MKKNTSDECKQSIQMCGSVTVGSKGQIVIPIEVRKQLGINPGDQLLVIVKDGKAVGLVKSEDLEQLMEYIKSEMN